MSPRIDPSVLRCIQRLPEEMQSHFQQEIHGGNADQQMEQLRALLRAHADGPMPMFAQPAQQVLATLPPPPQTTAPQAVTALSPPPAMQNPTQWSCLGNNPIDLTALSRSIQNQLSKEMGAGAEVRTWAKSPKNIARVLELLTDNPMDVSGLPNALTGALFQLMGCKENSSMYPALTTLISSARQAKYGALDSYYMEYITQHVVKGTPPNEFQEMLKQPSFQYNALIAISASAQKSMDQDLCLATIKGAIAIAEKYDLGAMAKEKAMRQLCFLSISSPNVTPEALHEVHHQWANLASQRISAQGITTPALCRAGERPRICVLLSNPTANTVVARFSQPWLSELKEWADVTIVDIGKNLSGDDMRDAQKIASQGFHAVIDLEGLTGAGHPELIAAPVAPVRITYVGYPSTSGLQGTQESKMIRIVDPTTDPPGSEALSTEEIVRVPKGPFLSYALPKAPPPAKEPPCVKNGFVTFGYYGNPTKLHQGIFEDWKKILDECPNARLALRYPHLNIEAVFAMADRVGIPKDRIQIVPPAPDGSKVWEGYDDIDIALDSYPYNGTTTTVDALSRGVPSVTCRFDERHAANVGASLLTAVGSEDLIANTRQEYIAKAVALAHDPERIKREKRELPERTRDTLCNADAFNKRFQPLLKSLVMGTND